MKRPLPVPLVLLTVVLAASVLLPPPGADGEIAHLPTVCPFYHLTGLPCPGCGLTRAFVCLGHGNLLFSLHWHPLGWLAYAACIIIWAIMGRNWLRGQPPPALPHLWEQRLSIAALALLLLSGAARIAWLLAHHQSWPI